MRLIRITPERCQGQWRVPWQWSRERTARTDTRFWGPGQGWIEHPSEYSKIYSKEREATDIFPILDSNEPIPGDANGLDAKRIPETISWSATICQISRHGGALNDCLLSKVSVWGPNRTSLQMQLQTASDELGSWPIHIHRMWKPLKDDSPYVDFFIEGSIVLSLRVSQE